MLIESSRAYGRECLLGVARYARTHGPWEVLHLERGLDGRLPREVQSWQPSGLLTRIDSATFLKSVDQLAVPTVDLRGAFRPANGAVFDTDHRAVSELAFDHLRDLGFRNYGFCGYPGVDFSDKRRDAFMELVESYGYRGSVYAPKRRNSGDDVTRRESLGELKIEDIIGWIHSLPKPVAVFACNDIRGRQVLRACLEAELSVPDEVAVLGVDDDEVICELSIPPLSSVEPDAERLGYEAAAMLETLLEGHDPPTGPVTIPPRGIRARLSSETSAIDDPTVAQAMRLIREDACRPLQVSDLARDLGVSRSTLERRFRDLLGRSPAAQIERQRMQRAQVLLHETDHKVSRVASATGYQSAAQFITAFKRSFGVTPGAFRSQRDSG